MTSVLYVGGLGLVFLAAVCWMLQNSVPLPTLTGVAPNTSLIVGGVVLIGLAVGCLLVKFRR